ncbi:glutamine synthetase family protein [Mycolicibacterium brisbanense]|uniref:Glutamine synthetase, catalytic domain protein n=1 Tax=Mycolicibacterium brisbanense TaxID=146020 RepID=A0A100W6U6_9MYCO|nr:glutamine synthetase family protein [Mycolicibacterium brisbanense]MCV7162148.1 glutamine synthetase [Mycolicibacterium brisbanense]GAS92797.1 glutamine synthetase, catalytic domain protein [Mycolicibacterium brisbanense]
MYAESVTADVVNGLPADAHSVVPLFPDIHGNLRGKLVEPRVISTAEALNEGIPTTDLLLAVDPLDEPITTLATMGLRGGAKDLLLRPDLSTLRPMPWFPAAYLLLGDLYETGGAPCAVSPRQVLRNALGALSSHGLQMKAAFEFEFRLFREGTWEPATVGLSYSPLTLSHVTEFIGTLRRYADDLRLGLSVVHSEGAPGLIEVNVDPQDGLAAADTAALLRLAATEAARRHGLCANFMAKPVAHEEGSSAHVHFSMWDEGGENALGSAARNPDDEFYRRAAWGMLTHLPALSLIYNPTINSYKRLVPGFFAPVSAACGPDDRSFALRALLKTPTSSRFELRRPGADCNPYLTLAAIAASVHLGLTDQSVPDRSHIDRHDGALPANLAGAISEFRRRDERLDTVLGAEFCAHYLQTREWELHAWQNAVSEWERQRYA